MAPDRTISPTGSPSSDDTALIRCLKPISVTVGVGPPDESRPVSGSNQFDGYKRLGLPKLYMELTRRDAAAALAAIGATGGVAAIGMSRTRRDREGGPRPIEDASDDRVRATLTAVAEVVYPSEVSGIEEFVGGFLEGRLSEGAHANGVRDTVAELDEHARSWYDRRVTELSVEERDRLLREVGADTAEEDPDGTTAERVRYYVVNELLLALYSSPKGGKLVGIENPQGYPGGAESYKRGP